MKKVVSLLLVAVMVLSMSACGAENSSETKSDLTATSQEETVSETAEETTSETVEESEVSEEKTSLISVVGVYYGDIYANQMGNCYSDQKLDGYTDCIVVFDYANDATNRTMPESTLEPGVIHGSYTCADVTLLVNDTNTYEAYDPNAYGGHYSNALNRYTSYSNPIGYGNLFGGAEPVRMYAVFYVNPNELDASSTAILTVDDQTIEFDFANIKEIAYPDEILESSDDYEIEQQIAAFKWRMDKLVELSGKVDHYMKSMNPGSDLSGVGSSIGNMFSSEYGVTISGHLPAGFESDYTYDGMNTDLPAFNMDTLTSALPDQAEEIIALVDAANQLGEAVQNSSYSKSDVEDILKEILEHYANLISAFDMEIYED